jgi:hypothetical protein
MKEKNQILNITSVLEGRKPLKFEKRVKKPKG